VTAGLAPLAQLIQRESGIALGPDRLPALAAAARRVAPGSDLDQVLSVAADPCRGSALLERLVDEVTVKETFFFRHTDDLDGIDWRALHHAALLAGRSEVRVWSAACATGEEVYTLAIVACEAFATSRPPVRILGTDIAPSALARARRGLYGARSVARVPVGMRARHLIDQEAVHAVADHLRALVRFERHNLVRDPTPPAGEAAFDLILCRNVLIYLDPPDVRRAVRGLEHALAPGGRLVLGSADRLCGLADLVDAHPPPTNGVSPTDARRAARRRERLERRPRPAATSSAVDALRAADAGRLEDAARAARAALERDGLDSAAHYVTGVIELDRGDAPAAVVALRRALFLQPAFALAAFALGRAQDMLGRPDAAARAYAQGCGPSSTCRSSTPSSSGTLRPATSRRRAVRGWRRSA
jgi:chemotaxis protein methyltransferase CheR